MIRVLLAGCYPMSAAVLAALQAAAHVELAGVLTLAPGPRPNPVLDWLAAVAAPPPLLTVGAPGDLAGLDASHLGRVDVLLCCAFPLLIPARLRGLARLEALNLHPSLLPLYRGADPIRRAILNGAPRTGVSLHCLTDDFDWGDVFAQWPLEIGPREDCGGLYRRLSELAAQMTPGALRDIARGDARSWPQDEALAGTAPAVTDGERLITPDMDPEAIDRIARANHPWRPAFMHWQGARLELGPDRLLPEERAARAAAFRQGDRFIIQGPAGAVSLRVLAKEG